MDLVQNILRSDEQTIFRLRGLYENYGYRRFKMSKFETESFGRYQRTCLCNMISQNLF